MKKRERRKKKKRKRVGEMFTLVYEQKKFLYSSLFFKYVFVGFYTFYNATREMISYSCI